MLSRGLLIIREHHERMERILAVADVLDTISSHRPYRSSLGIEAAISEIKLQRGILFDTEVVDAMLRLIREKGYQLPV
ncbi:MAG: hypothetical protein WCI23_03950 [Chlorobiaceae bacterium]